MSSHEDALIAADHVVHILGLQHPKPDEQLHPAVIGSAIYYLQKWTKIQNGPPNKIGAKPNGNIVMVWEDTNPTVAIDVNAANASADLLMQSDDGNITKKVDEEGTDARALLTVVNVLRALTAYANAEEPEDGEQSEQQPESPSEPDGVSLQA